MKYRKVSLPWTLLALLASPAFGAGHFVDAATDVDAPGGGSAAAPWRTITYALSQVAPSPGGADVIRVAAGTYDAANGEVFPLAPKPRVLVSGAGQGATVAANAVLPREAKRSGKTERILQA